MDYHNYDGDRHDAGFNDLSVSNNDNANSVSDHLLGGKGNKIDQAAQFRFQGYQVDDGDFEEGAFSVKISPARVTSLETLKVEKNVGFLRGLFHRIFGAPQEKIVVNKVNELNEKIDGIIKGIDKTIKSGMNEEKKRKTKQFLGGAYSSLESKFYDVNDLLTTARDELKKLEEMKGEMDFIKSSHRFRYQGLDKIAVFKEAIAFRQARNNVNGALIDLEETIVDFNKPQNELKTRADRINSLQTSVGTFVGTLRAELDIDPKVAQNDKENRKIPARDLIKKYYPGLIDHYNRLTKQLDEIYKNEKKIITDRLDKSRRITKDFTEAVTDLNNCRINGKDTSKAIKKLNEIFPSLNNLYTNRLHFTWLERFVKGDEFEKLKEQINILNEKVIGLQTAGKKEKNDAIAGQKLAELVRLVPDKGEVFDREQMTETLRDLFDIVSNELRLQEGGDQLINEAVTQYPESSINASLSLFAKFFSTKSDQEKLEEIQSFFLQQESMKPSDVKTINDDLKDTVFPSQIEWEYEEYDPSGD